MKLGVSSAFQNGILINDVLIMMMILMPVVMFVILFTMRLMIAVVMLTSACS